MTQRKAKGRVRDLFKYYEEGLTERQKHYVVQILDKAVATVLSEENIDTGSAVRSYGEVFDLTQADSYAKYQSGLLSRTSSERHPIEDVLYRVVQLEKSRLACTAMAGYLDQLCKQIDFACDNLKTTANAVFAAHKNDELGLVTVPDKDDITWQLYTTAATPDSAILRRKQVRNSLSHNKLQKGMKGWKAQEHQPHPPAPTTAPPSSTPSLKPKGRSQTP
jgi:hypothetical protein